MDDCCGAISEGPLGTSLSSSARSYLVVRGVLAQQLNALKEEQQTQHQKLKACRRLRLNTDSGKQSRVVSEMSTARCIATTHIEEECLRARTNFAVRALGRSTWQPLLWTTASSHAARAATNIVTSQLHTSKLVTFCFAARIDWGIACGLCKVVLQGTPDACAHLLLGWTDDALLELASVARGQPLSASFSDFGHETDGGTK
eukprot:5133700-Amphidinium_carterae.1